MRAFLRGVGTSLVLAILVLVTPHAEATVDVIEFYNASKDHYFITWQPEEIDALDSGDIKGWTRTGQQFRAHETAVNGTNPVCRYYIPEQGDSHFFSASPAECAKVRNFYPGFVEESDRPMHVAMPHQATGECKSSDEPVYRVWNRRLDSNHRYVTSLAMRDQMVAHGWNAEGYGPDAVVMCSPRSAAEADAVTASLPPPCKGTNSRVAVPGAPHGMYVWSPEPGAAYVPGEGRDRQGSDACAARASSSSGRRSKPRTASTTGAR